MAKKIQDSQKEANRLGKGIQKLIGEDAKFILMVEDGSNLANISNMTDRVQMIGLLEMTKHDYLTLKNNTAHE